MSRGSRGAALVAAASLLCCAGTRAGDPGTRAVAAAGPQGRVERFDTVVVDPGHGGEDRGARGVRGLIEKELVLDVSRRLAKRLATAGIDVVMTRTEDVTVPLETRTSIANDVRADLFLSVHANSSRSSKPRGIETYFAALEASDARALETAKRENMAFGAEALPAAPADPMVAIFGDMIAADTLRESNAFARMAQEELGRVPNGASRGVKQAPFVVLMGVQMPSALVEIGFVSNAAEERSLRDSKRREAIAAALERAVLAYAARYDAVRGISQGAR